MAQEKIAYESVPKVELNGDVSAIKPPKGVGIRHIQGLLLFISLSTLYAMRAQLGVTMESMTSKVMPRHLSLECHKTLKNNSVNDSLGHLGNDLNSEDFNNTQMECHEVAANLSMWNVYRTYEWKKSTHEMILFSFFVGYTSMQLPMGLFTQRFGGKLPIMIALGTNGLLSIMTPWLPIWFGWPALCICRLLQGMTQATMFPSIHTLLARWSPLCERGRISTCIYAGSQFGTILAFQIAGLFASSPTFRWPATFWCLGIASLVCFCFMGYYGAASPHEHRTITKEELVYITLDGSVDLIPKKRKTPWKHIITSRPVWGLMMSQVGSIMSALLVLTQIPMYMHKVLGMDIKRNGIFSSLPYVAMYITSLIFGFLADYAVNNKIMSVVNIRRTANTIGLVGSGLILLAFSYINNPTYAVITLILSLAAHAGIHVGFHINQIDLAPNFAGPVMALGNTLGNMSGLLVPVLVSSIVKDDVRNQSKWQMVFLAATLLQIVTNTIFVVFAKGDVQPWNFYGVEDNDEEKEVMKSDMKDLEEKENEDIKSSTKTSEESKL